MGEVQEWELPEHRVEDLSARKSKYAVIIPVINEGSRVRNQLQAMKVQGIARMADIIIADGNSTDGSLDLDFLRELEVRAKLVKLGPGKLGAQLRMAYAFALRQGYEGVVTVDGNNKDGTAAIGAMIQELENGLDMVQGSRFIPGGVAINTPASRYWAIKLVHAPVLTLAARFRWTDTTNGFRGYSRKLLFYISARAPRLGLKCKEIPVERRYPAKEKIPTKISPVRGNIKVLVTLFRTAWGAYNPCPRRC